MWQKGNALILGVLIGVIVTGIGATALYLVAGDKQSLPLKGDENTMQPSNTEKAISSPEDKVYNNNQTGISFSYPNNWTLIDQKIDNNLGFGLQLYQPGTTPDNSMPQISISYSANTPYLPEPTPQQYFTNFKTLQIGTLNGRESEEIEDSPDKPKLMVGAMCGLGHEIHFPHRTGTVVIYACKNAPDIIQAVEKILQTLKLY